MTERRPNRENQRDQGRTGGEAVRAKCNRDISTRQPLAQDARPDHGGQQEGRPQGLSYNTPGHSIPLRAASRPALQQ
jgi:hypothetical protein